MNELAKLEIKLTDLWLPPEMPFPHDEPGDFSEVDEFDSIHGDLWATVGGVPFPEMEVFSSGEVNVRQPISELVGLRHIKKVKATMSLQFLHFSRFKGKVEREHDSLFITFKNGRTPVPGFDRVELSKAQVCDEISVFKKAFLEIATQKSSRQQAETLWESIAHEPVDDAHCNFWNW